MNDNDHADLIFRLSAIECLLTWLAAKEIKREGNDNRLALGKFSDSVHAMLDENRPPHPLLQRMQEEVSARLDGLVQMVADQVQRP